MPAGLELGFDIKSNCCFAMWDLKSLVGIAHIFHSNDSWIKIDFGFKMSDCFFARDLKSPNGDAHISDIQLSKFKIPIRDAHISTL